MKRMGIYFSIFILCFSLYGEYFEPGSNGNEVYLTIRNQSSHFDINDLSMNLNTSETSIWIKDVEFTPNLGTIPPNGEITTIISFDIDDETWGDVTGILSFDLIESTGVKHTVQIDINLTLIFSEIFKPEDVYHTYITDPDVITYYFSFDWLVVWGSPIFPGFSLEKLQLFAANSLIIGNYGYIPPSLPDTDSYTNEYTLVGKNTGVYNEPIPVLSSVITYENTIEIDEEIDYNTELRVWIGLNKSMGSTIYDNYDDSFKLYVDKGNGWQIAIKPSVEYHMAYSPTPDDPDYYNWVDSAPYTFIEYRTDLGKISTMKIKIEGDISYGESICFDNISAQYIKDRIVGTPPENLYAEKDMDGKTMNLTWSAPATSKGLAPLYYRVYKNANLIADNITDLSFTDHGNEYGKDYEYAISAVYSGIYPSSILDCWIKVQTDEWKAEPPPDFQLFNNSGIEYCNIDLTWSAALPVAQEQYQLTNYFVYRDDNRIATLPPSATDFTDFFVRDGVHDYFITCGYADVYESIPSYTLTAHDIISTQYFPDQFYDFENSGEYPIYWACTIPDGAQYPYWKITNEEGNYFVEILAEYDEGSGVTIEDANKYNKLRTPKFNLLSYQNVKIGFDYKATNLTSEFSVCSLFVKHYNQFENLYDTLAVIEDDTPTWNHIDIPLDYGIVSPESFLIFELKQETDSQIYSVNSRVSIDNLSITGDYLNPPINFTAKLESDQTVKLIWEEPIISINLIGYNIYRNGVLLSTVDKSNSNFIDYDLLDHGFYEYSITAIYDPYSNESIPATSYIVIDEVYLLPLIENFETEGKLPENWSEYYQETPPAWEFVDVNSDGSILPAEGEYFAYLKGGNFYYPEKSRKLITPKLNLSLYSEVKLKFKENLFANDGTSTLNVFLHDDENDTSQLIHTQHYENIIDWNEVEIPIQSTSTCCSFEFEAIIRTYERMSSIAEVCLDAIEVTGTANIPAPSNIRITNDQGFVSLTWDPVQNASKYHIYRSEYPDKGFEEIAVVEKVNNTTGEIYTSYTDIKKIDNMIFPAVDTFKKAYYYKIATEVGILKKAFRRRQ